MATMIVLAKVKADTADQHDLFSSPLRTEQMRTAAHVIDEVGERFGKHKLALGTSLFLGRHRVTERDDVPARKNELLPGEMTRQRLALPRMNVTV